MTLRSNKITTSTLALPRVQGLARRAPAVSPTTSFADICEQLRVSPYRMLPVVDAAINPTVLLQTGPLIGVITDKSITDAFLHAPTDAARDAIRTRAIAVDLMIPLAPTDCALPGDTADSLSLLLDRVGRDAVPVIESPHRPFYLGMVARSDMVRDLTRSFHPPQIGGMATPLGVYLTTGSVSGGVGTLALAATGLFTFALHLAGIATIVGSTYAIHRYVPQLDQWTQHLPRPLGQMLPEALLFAVQIGLFFVLLRNTPLAGYHAAEHQVVHAIERGEPLLPENVRSMPRVHPRCSTNLVAGMLLFLLIGTTLSPLLEPEIGYMLGAMAAFFWWRPLGSWLQQHATTRPPTEREIESGIRAAKELLRALDAPIETAPRNRSPLAARFSRIWHMGFLQIFLGGGLAWAVVFLLANYVPFLRELLER